MWKGSYLSSRALFASRLNGALFAPSALNGLQTPESPAVPAARGEQPRRSRHLRVPVQPEEAQVIEAQARAVV